MDKLDQNSNSNIKTELPSITSNTPIAADENPPNLEDTLSKSEIVAPTQEFSSEVPVSVPPVVATSLSSWLERYWKLTLIAILIAAVALRMWGLNWDEGQHLHPDERFLSMVESAIKLPSSFGQYFDTANSPLNPYNNNFGTFAYGTAPLFFVRLIGELIGLNDYGKVVLLGRALSALADVFVLATAFFIGRRLYGLRIGLLAALLYAFSVLSIKQSHFFTVDTFTNVPLMLAFWFTLDIVEGKRGGWAFVLAGACFGLMLASRINMLPFIGIIAIAALLRLTKILEDVQRMTIEVSNLNLKRTFEAADSAASDSPEVHNASSTRSFRVGPLLIEIEYKAGARAGTETGDAKLIPWVSVRSILGGLMLAVVAAIIIFRIAQPYAFDGFLKLNPQFLDDMAKTQRVISGQDDYPPGHQWTNRAPYWFPWYNLVVWGLGPALGVTAWLGVALAAFQVMRNRRWEHLLILLWVVGMFFYHGQQFVKTMRYFLPLYPFLAIFAAFFLFALWGEANALMRNVRYERFTKSARFFAGLMFAIVIGMTFFWAIASTSIYTRTNTRVAASRWIYAKVADSETLGVEHWDDVLPLRVDGKDYYRDHQGVLLELYGEDTIEKRELMVEWMDQVDYIVLSSNRLYGSIPRLPMRFPLTTKYYEWLFNGQLGFEQVEEFTSYPQFLGITINDDNAEEAFTVYDHPKVTIFRKTSEYSHDNIVKLFNSVDLTEVLRLKPIDATASRRQFQMTPVELAANRAGGTWSNLFNQNDLANRFPVLIWLVMVWGIGILAFPFTYVVFRSFADRGYSFAKALGVLFAAWFGWTLSSYHILPFGRLPIFFGLVVMVAYGLLIWNQHWQEMLAYVRTNLKLLLIEELVFFVFFAIDLAIRYRNPDLWHPWLGGEKPMDFAFLNAIVKTTYFPPYNPWFGGNYINYYYFGQLISATLVRLSGITPEVAYNLLIPLFFALTASSAYGVVFNLVLSGRQRLVSKAQLSAEETSSSNILLPSITGIFAIILVLIIGNLGEVKLAFKGLTELGGGSGIAAVITGLNKWLFAGQPIPIRIGDWYWVATRVIPDTINEFPFFTFVYGDLHAHLIAIPYALAALGLAAHIVLSRSKLLWSDLGLIALVLGALRAINTWDYPTYLGVIGAAMILKLSMEMKEQDDLAPFDWHEWLQQWLRFILMVFFQIILIMVPMNLLGIRMNVEVAIYMVILLFSIVIISSHASRSWDPYQLIQKVGWPLIAIITLSVVFFLPYILNYATGYVSVELWKGTRTTLSEYLTVHGIFLFIATTFFIVVILTNYLREEAAGYSGFELTGWALFFVSLLLIAEIILIVLKLPILALVVPLLSLGIWIILHRKTPIEVAWVSVLIIGSLLLTLLVEFIVLKGDVGRSNTVFKFYLQAWVMFGVAGATGLGLMIEHFMFARRAETSSHENTPVSNDLVPIARPSGKLSYLTSRPIRWVWWGALTLLTLSGLVYPFAAARAKMNDRYVEGSPAGLNGMDYLLRGAKYNENNQELDLRQDYEAIQWMRANIKGSPVIMEGNTGLYRWGNRYSIYTGLPTVIGWDWHTKQQYSLLPGDLIDYRISLVKEFYNTLDQARAIEIARHYDVSYVIVGGLERAVYDPNGLNKFEGMVQQGILLKVYDANNVQVYQAPASPTASQATVSR
jgi:YYY domain-containing protein